MTRKGRRIAMIAGALSVVAAAAGLALYALSDNIGFFYSPSELAARTRSARVCASADWLSRGRWQNSEKTGSNFRSRTAQRT